MANDGHSLTFITPAHASGPVGVTATTAGCTTGELPFTYDHTSTAQLIAPDRGPVTGGTSVTITGTGFVPGATSVVIGGFTSQRPR